MQGKCLLVGLIISVANTLSDILGRRINPHLFKASCVTYLLETGRPLEAVSKYVAHH